MLLEQENVRLFRRLETLVAELAEARGEDALSLQLEIDLLKGQLASRTKALFEDSSERRCGGEHKGNEERKEPRSVLGKAISYTSGLWPGLVRFLGDPKIPLDSNGAERALRGVAVGRKNHYGSRSERGTRVAALFYSLIESAKLAGVEPRACLRGATLRVVRNPGSVTLGHDLKSSQS